MTKDTRWVARFTLFCLLTPVAFALLSTTGCDSNYPPVPDDYQVTSGFSDINGGAKVDGSKLNHLIYQEHQDNMELRRRPQTDAARGSFGALA